MHYLEHPTSTFQTKALNGTFQINGGVECGKGPDSRVADRIGYYTRYCGLLGTDTGGNLDCYSQRNFAS
jgi:hypothetical protein